MPQKIDLSEMIGDIEDALEDHPMFVLRMRSYHEGDIHQVQRYQENPMLFAEDQEAYEVYVQRNEQEKMDVAYHQNLRTQGLFWVQQVVDKHPRAADHISDYLIK